MRNTKFVHIPTEHRSEVPSNDTSVCVCDHNVLFHSFKAPLNNVRIRKKQSQKFQTYKRNYKKENKYRRRTILLLL